MLFLMPYTLPFSLKVQRYPSWDITIHPRKISTLTPRTIASREPFVATLTNIILNYIPRNIFILVPSCSKNILWSIPTSKYITLPKYPHDSTFLGNFKLKLLLIRAPDPRTPPPFKWYWYEHHYSRLSYLLYSLHLPIKFNSHHRRPISHVHLQKNLCGIHRQWISLIFIFYCKTALGQTKII